MKKMTGFGISLVFICIFTLGYLYIQQRALEQAIAERNEKLANKLGIKLADYEGKSFPLYYFATSLKEGMTIREVHQVMRGYYKVLNCGGFAEVYYYFSWDDETADRYMVGYDEGLYIGTEYGGLQARQPGLGGDSSYVLTYRDGCKNGLLEEK